MPHGRGVAVAAFQAMYIEGGKPGATFKVGQMVRRGKENAHGRGGFDLLEVTVGGETLQLYPKDCRLFLVAYKAGQQAGQAADGRGDS
jgi:hypothetical protein